jgi:heme/copper-type cytochrome/quinol oxidase subunit 2
LYVTPERLSSKVTHNSSLEFIWTTLPCIFLGVLIVPSLHLLYSMEHESTLPDLTVKIVGSQWFWTYDQKIGLNFGYKDLHVYFRNNVCLEFESRMVMTSDLALWQPRLLTVDTPLVLPVGNNIRLLITSSDVLHSWTVPSFGIKLDACPGRLNMVNLTIWKNGTFRGQCSEICGTNHAFMPIEVVALDHSMYINWLELTILGTPNEFYRDCPFTYEEWALYRFPYWDQDGNRYYFEGPYDGPYED